MLSTRTSESCPLNPVSGATRVVDVADEVMPPGASMPRREDGDLVSSVQFKKNCVPGTRISIACSYERACCRRRLGTNPQLGGAGGKAAPACRTLNGG